MGKSTNDRFKSKGGARLGYSRLLYLYALNPFAELLVEDDGVTLTVNWLLRISKYRLRKERNLRITIWPGLFNQPEITMVHGEVGVPRYFVFLPAPGSLKAVEAALREQNYDVKSI